MRRMDDMNAIRTKCRRCGKELHMDVWDRWVDRGLWQTCGGDRPHDPVRKPA